MMIDEINIPFFPILLLGGIGCLGAFLLYIVSRIFSVKVDHRLEKIVDVLPGANCGGCGFAGCSNFAEACLKASSLEGLRCPVGGDKVMKEVAKLLGGEVSESEPMIAVVRCAGDCKSRSKTNTYDGAKECAILSALYGGETNCPYGCLGLGDCVRACTFGAISINPSTGLPEIKEDKCTACGACVKACPKGIIELRKKEPLLGRVYVGCMNMDRGSMARNACLKACIGCGKCKKICPAEAIQVDNNLAYIDYTKCKKCGKCIGECPTGAICTSNPKLQKQEIAQRQTSVKV